MESPRRPAREKAAGPAATVEVEAPSKVGDLVVLARPACNISMAHSCSATASSNRPASAKAAARVSRYVGVSFRHTPSLASLTALLPSRSRLSRVVAI